MKKVLCLAALVAGVIGVSAAQASSPGTSTTKGRSSATVVDRAAHANPRGGSGQLSYHGGPVMHTNTTYAIYWVPSGYSMQDGYSTLIDQYFTDVAADSGLKTNVYYTATQYHDGTGKLSYSSTFGGSYTDTNPLPASGCTDSYTSVCLTNSQLKAELKSVIAANGWTVGPSTLFFLFTAKGIGSCYSSTSCAFAQYCGFHGHLGTGSTEILWADMPYADTSSRCDGGQHPNGNDADATINITSHEHNEAITDPELNAWYDSTGAEDGDKCAWLFGTLSGTAGAKYNQTINGHHYFLQKEWSNHDKGCVQTGL